MFLCIDLNTHTTVPTMYQVRKREMFCYHVTTISLNAATAGMLVARITIH